MDITAWRAQLVKGASELAVLAVLEEKERYGLEIVEVLADENGLNLSEGTIYPLLNRLLREGKLSFRWIQAEGTSHPRKYYCLSEDGASVLAGMKEEWAHFSTSIGAFLERKANGAIDLPSAPSMNRKEVP